VNILVRDNNEEEGGGREKERAIVRKFGFMFWETITHGIIDRFVVFSRCVVRVFRCTWTQMLSTDTHIDSYKYIDWWCFYYFILQSLEALLEALFSRILLDLRSRCTIYVDVVVQTCIHACIHTQIRAYMQAVQAATARAPASISWISSGVTASQQVLHTVIACTWTHAPSDILLKTRPARLERGRFV